MDGTCEGDVSGRKQRDHESNDRPVIPGEKYCDAVYYMYHHIVEALFEGGLEEEAIQLMKDYWGKMIDLGADTFWEAFDPDQPDYSPYGSPILNSYCNVWSCTPVYLIHKYILKDF